MYYDDELSEIMGAHCTLMEDYRGYSDGEIVCDYGNEVVVRLTNGHELLVYRDEAVIYD